MATSKATAQWFGNFKTGQGMMKPAHAAEMAFTTGTRFENQNGTNPEELIGAAFAGCFSMALSVGLEKAGATPKSIRTSASVKVDRDGDGFTIKSIDLTTEVDAPGMDMSKLQSIAEQTRQGCPVGKALASVGDVTVKAMLASGAPAERRV